MKDITWTVEEMLAEEPCKGYSELRLRDLWGGQERVTLEQILAFDIPDKDKVWVCARLKNTFRIEWLERIVTRAVKKYALTCGVPEVEAWAEGWLSGKDRTACAAADAANAVHASYAAACAAHASYAAACAATDAAYVADIANAATWAVTWAVTDAAWASCAAARAAYVADTAACAANAAACAANAVAADAAYAAYATAHVEIKQQVQDMLDILAEQAVYK